MQDYLAILGQGGELNPLILERVSQRLANQVSRGQEIIGRMNRFAHSGDHPRAEIDLADAVELTLGLQKRLAALGDAEFSLEATEKIPLTTNQFLLEDLIWRALSFASSLAKGGSPCAVRVLGSQGGGSPGDTRPGFQPAGAGERFPPGAEENYLLGLLNGILKLEPERGRMSIALENI